MSCELYCAAEYALTMVWNQDVEIDPKLRIKSVPGRGVMHDRRSASDAKEQEFYARNSWQASFGRRAGDEAFKRLLLRLSDPPSVFQVLAPVQQGIKRTAASSKTARKRIGGTC